MSRPDGGPAFPRREADGCEYARTQGEVERLSGSAGMSLRDWFAGKAISGSLAGVAWVEPLSNSPESFAARAYKIADAMIAERAKVQS